MALVTFSRLQESAPPDFGLSLTLVTSRDVLAIIRKCAELRRILNSMATSQSDIKDRQFLAVIGDEV